MLRSNSQANLCDLLGNDEGTDYPQHSSDIPLSIHGPSELTKHYRDAIANQVYEAS